MSTGSTFERSLYVANVLGGFYFGALTNAALFSLRVLIQYEGLQTYMCFHSWHLLYRRKGINRRTRNFYIFYGFTMLLLSICSWVGNALEGQLMWINHRNYPGGPLAYYFAESTSWFSVISTASPVVQSFMNDALLVSRWVVKHV